MMGYIILEWLQCFISPETLKLVLYPNIFSLSCYFKSAIFFIQNNDSKWSIFYKCNFIEAIRQQVLIMEKFENSYFLSENITFQEC